jgi:hypothetical protein
LGRVAGKPSSQSFSCQFDLIWLPKCTFPHSRHSPSIFEQGLTDSNVSLDICREFLMPEFRARGWRRGVATINMPMPKTAMDEYDSPMLGKNEVGMALHPWRM